MRTITADAGEGTLLSRLLQQLNIDYDAPCAGQHRCGKCKLRAWGQLSPLTPPEAAFLTPAEISDGLRLACFTTAWGQVRLELPPTPAARILAAGQGEIAPLEPLMEPGGFGAAIDLGTTTIVCSLYAAESGRCLDSCCQLNQQRRFGADVISRIAYSNEHGPAELHRVLCRQLEGMLDQLCSGQGVERQRLNRAVITGNTTMLHYFAGLDPQGIGCAPFTPASRFDCDLSGLLTGVEAYLPPCVSAYVGADLLCCLLASGGLRRDQLALVVDIGTNGEMALIDRGRVLCCSTAAGPAFEGASLSQGMPALTGAICRVSQGADGEISYSTINDQPPQGVCSSAVVDLLALLLRQGAMRPDGRLLDTGHPLSRYFRRVDGKPEFVFPGTDIAVNQADVRQLQLAKSAISAGIQTLLAEAGYRAGQLERLYLAGGFGTYLDLDSAAAIGLLPAGIHDKTQLLGNGAAFGAALLLMEKQRLPELREINQRCRSVELSSSSRFMELYLDSMSFSPEAY